MSEKSTKINGLPEFKEPFAERIVEYINYKRAQGYKLHDPIVYRLREMDLFFLEMGVREIKITREMYEAWTAPRPTEKETTTQKRQNAVRGFANYLVLRGYKNIYTGYDDARIFKSDFIPYIYSREEISRMFRALSGPCINFPGYNSDTFRMAMLMYYCCGFRKSEVQNLKVRDIEFQTGRITILNGKNDVSRIVVASNSLLGELQTYFNKYLRNADPGDSFIHVPKSKRYTECMLYENFHRLLSEAAIPPKPDGGRQRLHDICHTFCIGRLSRCRKKDLTCIPPCRSFPRILGISTSRKRSIICG